jgi:hypothetical protein
VGNLPERVVTSSWGSVPYALSPVHIWLCANEVCKG